VPFGKREKKIGTTAGFARFGASAGTQTAGQPRAAACWTPARALVGIVHHGGRMDGRTDGANLSGKPNPNPEPDPRTRNFAECFLWKMGNVWETNATDTHEPNRTAKSHPPHPNESWSRFPSFTSNSDEETNEAFPQWEQPHAERQTPTSSSRAARSREREPCVVGIDPINRRIPSRSRNGVIRHIRKLLAFPAGWTWIFLPCRARDATLVRDWIGSIDRSIDRLIDRS
jgi:hypothetical protein